MTHDALDGVQGVRTSASSPVSRPVPFVREADMLAPLAANRSQFTSSLDGWETLYEVQTMRGIVDVLFVVPNEQVLTERSKLGLPPIENPSAVAALLALTPDRMAEHNSPPMSEDESAGATSGELAPYVSVTHDYLRRHVLPKLVETGWVIRLDRDRWMATVSYATPVRRIVAVEVKRVDWRRGLTQAAPHTEFADSTYVALDAARLPKVRLVMSAFRLAHVGLVSVSADGEESKVKVLVSPGRPRPTGLTRAVVAERIAALLVAGRRSGPIGHVFGRVLTASVDPDPRSAIGSAKALCPQL